ncbi:MAG: M20 family metallopeptidase [Clostridia bacterium]|nr:M20 family metallopeptidase [Clostridia bacterium]
MINKIKENINQHKEDILRISHRIHDYAELGFEEHQSSALICEYLEELGYKVQRGVEELKTAFIARKGNENSNIKIAILAEYDALPGIGHGCGHNIIAAVATGVASGFEHVLSDDLENAELLIIGTPAEESGGGKIELLNRGVFDEVDYVMMVHPSAVNMVGRGGTALVELNVEFKGKRAHSSAPEEGINALKALIHTFNGIDAIQSELPLGININGVIKNGGEASNIIPEVASAEFIIRGLTLKDLKKAKQKIIQVLKASEMLSGAKVSYDFELPYAERYPNPIMAEKFKKIMEDEGHVVLYPEKNVKLGSSDIGNISLYKPSIHPYIKIGDHLKGHTLDFMEKSRSETADEMILTAAKALGTLTYEIFINEDFRKEIKDAFMKQVPDYTGFEF